MTELLWVLVVASIIYALLLAVRAFVSRKIAKAMNEAFERGRK